MEPLYWMCDKAKKKKKKKKSAPIRESAEKDHVWSIKHS